MVSEFLSEIVRTFDKPHPSAYRSSKNQGIEEGNSQFSRRISYVASTGLPWFSEYGFQQTRRFNALKLAWVIQQAGRTGLVAHVVRHNALAQYMASLIDAAPDLERLAPVELSIVCFRYIPDELRGDEERLDAVNKAIMEELQIGGKAFLNGTLLHGRFVLRSCALHYALTEADVVAILEEVRQAGARCST
jgi:aromatic-L-amino-acid/L-tryptophan decarboxylase